MSCHVPLNSTHKFECKNVEPAKTPLTLQSGRPRSSSTLRRSPLAAAFTSSSTASPLSNITLVFLSTPIFLLKICKKRILVYYHNAYDTLWNKKGSKRLYIIITLLQRDWSCFFVLFVMSSLTCVSNSFLRRAESRSPELPPGIPESPATRVTAEGLYVQEVPHTSTLMRQNIQNDEKINPR